MKVSTRNRPTKDVAYWKFLNREMQTVYKSENKRESSMETCQLFYLCYPGPSMLNNHYVWQETRVPITDLPD